MAEEGIDLDAIYSASLALAEQVMSIQRLYQETKGAFVLSIQLSAMAGKMYPTYTQELDAMNPW